MAIKLHALSPSFLCVVVYHNIMLLLRSHPWKKLSETIWVCHNIMNEHCEHRPTVTEQGAPRPTVTESKLIYKEALLWRELWKMHRRYVPVVTKIVYHLLWLTWCRTSLLGCDWLSTNACSLLRGWLVYTSEMVVSDNGSSKEFSLVLIFVWLTVA